MKSPLTLAAIALAATAICVAATVNAADKNKKMPVPDLKQCTRVEIATTLGNIEIALYNETPKHRDNFLKLVAEGYYDGVLFHRVIQDFMIQTGDGKSKNAAPGELLGEGDLDYTIEPEFRYPTLFHKRGAVAAAREGDDTNPGRRSSASQFYIVTGKRFMPSQLAQMESKRRDKQMQEALQSLVAPHRKQIMLWRRAGEQAKVDSLQTELFNQAKAQVARDGQFTFGHEQVTAYTQRGGTPHLDGQYTVFGEVTKGMNVVEKIESRATDSNDRPVDDVKIVGIRVKK